MSAVDVITAAGAGVGIITGGIGVAVALRADRRAKRANENAQAANSIAEEANRIAEEANQFSQESNAITRRQAAQQNEHWVVSWSTAWEKDDSVLVLQNTGSHRARQSAVVIRGRDIHQVHDQLDEVEPGHRLTLALPEIAEQRKKTLVENHEAMQRLAAQGVFFAPKSFSRNLTITITWRTGEDAIREEVLQQRVS